MSEIATSNKILKQYKNNHSSVNGNEIKPALSIPVISITDAVIADVKDTDENIVNHSAPTQVLSIAELFQTSKVDLSKEIIEPQNALQILCDNSLSVFATLGNFSLIIGKAKSRKTFFISLLVAAFIAGRTVMNKFQSALKPGKNKVLWFDSEQSEYHVQRTYQRTLLLADTQDNQSLNVHALRRFDTKTRLAIIEFAIYNTEELAVVVIDGIRDLVIDINSAEEATMIANKLLKWTEERNIHIVTVLHQNKADNNARGHVGTELINKAESVLSIAKDTDNTNNSIVTPEYFRDKEFKQFAFSINEQGLLYVLDEWINDKPLPGGKAKKLTANEIPDAQHFDVLKEVFKNLVNPTYGKLSAPLAVAFQKYGVELAEKRQAQFLAYYNQKGWFSKEKMPGIAHDVYKINIPL